MYPLVLNIFWYVWTNILMQVKEIDIDTEKIKDYGFCKKKYEISFVGGPTTPTYSKFTISGVYVFE